MTVVMERTDMTILQVITELHNRQANYLLNQVIYYYITHEF